MPARLIEQIRGTYRPDVAYRHVAAISQFHRIQASPGYRAAAAYVAEQLGAAGLSVVTQRYPARPGAHFWSEMSFQEWECESASLMRLDGQGLAVETLCDFASIPTSLIQRSIPVEGDFDVVALPDGASGAAADYANLDVAGKMVLANTGPARLLEPALRERGAAGILFDGMRAGGRSELDLPDARQYTSFWWPSGSAADGWGFVLSPRQGQRLRAALARGEAVRVRASIRSRLYDGEFEVVEAAIPGQTEQEVLLVAHLCHPQPGAHDNASGAAALLESAATLARLLRNGQLAAARRGIRFLWVPEMTGTYAWLAQHEAAVAQGRWIAGLNLDMVGADQNVTGSTWQFVDLPQAGAAFADHLLNWLSEPFLSGQRHEETPFSAGSDHYILSDPSVGIPSPMLIQWPDRYYHTSADTLDKVSPDSLARSGALSAAYAWWLAVAGLDDAHWLGHWMVGRHAGRATKAAAEVVAVLKEADDDLVRRDTWAAYLERSAFAAERMSFALGSLVRLDPAIDAELAALRAQVKETTQSQAAWAAARSGMRAAATPPAEGVDAAVPGEAERHVPRRCQPGPIDSARLMQSRPAALRKAYEEMVSAAGDDWHEAEALLQYWADGRRTVAEIGRLAGLETGRALGETVLRYFKLLAETGLVEFV
jgi:hypothetical protein